ncbi:aspartate/glutamate racemase family protein [Ralstonia insidiosa]|uniref:Hydantoin racemase n=1 Tax=Ralstonia insidiosa TaxID=190721 RepID=A0A192A422_9RALS|nr:aspartate/glutamate racemase family protein [Ralstonia insidiosa]ANJ75032.1 hydantoin racemase [Ralstonia insidiosa]KAB0468243.1 aspartate/glutamate racemase family protein [Ralstonia insidiosa]MBY4910943.1 aspartate/glutamate racemase family protein [Ralstonia insidiosa]
MPNILLINPNSSRATTDMMVRIAQEHAPAGYTVVGATAANGPSMIINEVELAAAATEVEATWRSTQVPHAGVIISAFGDPGVMQVREASRPIPVVGICEASMLEASEGGRRFGVATVTPDLVAAIDAKAHALGLGALYTGVQLTPGEPRGLAADAGALEEALSDAVRACLKDGAQAVIIGGGPLGQAAVHLAQRFDVPIIAPISAAMRRLSACIAGGLAAPAGTAKRA